MKDFPCVEEAFESHMNIDAAMLEKAPTGQPQHRGWL